MRKDEYIAEVTSGIKSEYVKLEISAELGGHIDELTDFYLERGYTETEAEEKAVLEMGDGEKLDIELSKLHNGGYSVVGSIIFCVFCIAFPLFNIFILIMSGILDNGAYLSNLNVFQECLFIITILIMMLISLKKQSITRCVFVCISFFIYAFCIGFLVFDISYHRFCSPIVTYTLCLFMGETEAFGVFPYAEVQVLPILTVISIVFYVFIFTVLFINVIAINNLCGKYYSAKDKRRFRIVRIFLRTALVFCVVFIITFSFLKTYANTKKDNIYTVETTQIAQNNNMVNVQGITDISVVNGFNSISVSHSYNSNKAYWEISIDSSDKAGVKYTFAETNNVVVFHNLLNYTKNEYKLDIYPEKDYMYIYTTNYIEWNIVESFNTGWYITDKEIEYKCTGVADIVQSESYVLDVIIHPKG